MNIWQRGMAILGIMQNPEKLFRASLFVRDNHGNQALYFMVQDEKDIPYLLKIFETHGVKMTPYKSSIDNYKVLKILAHEIHQLPNETKTWLLGLHNDIKTISNTRKPDMSYQIQSAIKSIRWVTDSNGAIALYFMVKTPKDLDFIAKHMEIQGIKLTQHETHLNKTPEIVLKTTDTEIKKLSPDSYNFLTLIIEASKTQPFCPNRQR